MGGPLHRRRSVLTHAFGPAGVCSSLETLVLRSQQPGDTYHVGPPPRRCPHR